MYNCDTFHLLNGWNGVYFNNFSCYIDVQKYFLYLRLMLSIRLHDGVVASTVASQQEGRGFNSRSGRSFSVEFACSPRVSVDSLRVLRLPPTVQRHAAG